MLKGNHWEQILLFRSGLWPPAGWRVGTEDKEKGNWEWHSGTSYKANLPISRRLLIWCTQLSSALKISDTNNILSQSQLFCLEITFFINTFILYSTYISFFLSFLLWFQICDCNSTYAMLGISSDHSIRNAEYS